MTELFQQLLEWVSLHPNWSSAVIFLVAMAESLAIVGLIVPGVIIMFGIGALISSDAIAFWPALGWAVAGAITGDSFSFWLGVRYRHRLTSIWPFNRHPESLNRGIEFFQRFGGKSVAIGRFFGPVRAVIPLVAGMLGMPAWRFLLANIASALVWAPAYLLPGIVFGASLELASTVAVRLVAILLLLVALIWISFATARYLFKHLAPYSKLWLHQLLKWSKAHPHLGQLTASLVDPDHPEARGLSILTTLLLLALSLFVLLLAQLPNGLPLLSADQWVLNFLQNLRSPLADQIMVYLTRLTDDGVVLSVTVGVAALLFIQKHRRTLAYWGAAAAFCLLVGPLLKMGLQIPRPEVVALLPKSYSFPSGHTLKAVVLYGFLAVMISRPMAASWRWLPYSICGALMAAVALSRVYLGVHWLSDVLGSITLGISWVALLGTAYYHHTHVETRWGRLTLISLISIGLGYSAETILRHEIKIEQYQQTPPAIVEITQTQWQQLPPDTASEHINFQFSGEAKWLRQQLLQKGWLESKSLGWSNSLELLAPMQPLQQIPALPKLYMGTPAALQLIKPINETMQFSIRLWPTRYRIAPNNKALWIGAAIVEQKRTILGTVSYAQSSGDHSTAREQLFEDLDFATINTPTEKPEILLLSEPAGHTNNQ